MSTLFKSTQGCVYAVTRGQSTGFYQIRGFPTGGNPPILLIGADLVQHDINMPVTTLSSDKLIYVFGQDISDIRINGLALLGPSGQSGSGANMAQVFKWFSANRISNGANTVALSVPGNGYMIYVTGMGLSQPDPEFNIQPFVIFALITDPS